MVSHTDRVNNKCIKLFMDDLKIFSFLLMLRHTTYRFQLFFKADCSSFTVGESYLKIMLLKIL